MNVDCQSIWRSTLQAFVMRKLVDRHIAHSPRSAKRLVERRDPLVWDALAECMHEKVVLLNRAPTLHRLSIQAFEPRLVEGHAIRLHPLVCSAFNLFGSNSPPLAA